MGQRICGKLPNLPPQRHPTWTCFLLCPSLSLFPLSLLLCSCEKLVGYPLTHPFLLILLSRSKWYIEKRIIERDCVCASRKSRVDRSSDEWKVSMVVVYRDGLKISPPWRLTYSPWAKLADPSTINNGLFSFFLSSQFASPLNWFTEFVMEPWSDPPNISGYFAAFIAAGNIPGSTSHHQIGPTSLEW